jgi:hypothetical protein
VLIFFCSIVTDRYYHKLSPVFLYLYLGVTLLPSDTDQPSIFVAYGFSGWIKGTCSNEKKLELPLLNAP